MKASAFRRWPVTAPYRGEQTTRLTGGHDFRNGIGAALFLFVELIVDHFIFGLNLKRRVCVISPKIDEITDFVLYQLHSGVTLNEITGAYHKNPQKEMITIVDKHEYRKLMDFVKETDPKAFVTVYAVNEICYQPKL